MKSKCQELPPPIKEMLRQYGWDLDALLKAQKQELKKDEVKYMTMKEAIEYTRQSRWTLSHWAELGLIEACKPGGKILFVKSSIDQLMASSRISSQEEGQ